LNPQATGLWRAPAWALAFLLALLSMLAPFAVDTYLPAFSGIAQTLQAGPVQMQQTLSSYLFGYALMNLFHGALSDSIGRKPVIQAGTALFTLASLGCALSESIGALVFFRALQGMSTGAGVVVSRAIIRDMFPPAQAQRVMSQVTLYFGIAPAIAPIIGGWLFVNMGWHSIFWLLTALGLALFAVTQRWLPETLHVQARQPFEVRHLMRGYWQLASSLRFVLLCLASGIPFNGMFLYVLSAPAFLGELLKLRPEQFFWLFLLNIAGIMLGAWLSGRQAGRWAPKRQIRHGFVIMLLSALVNLVANWFWPAHVSWALIPIAVFSLGWALVVPVVTLLVLDLHPERRGMASSLQAVIGALANGIVAGAIAPLVMHSTVALALACLTMLMVGLGAWLWLHRRWPEIGRHVPAALPEHPAAQAPS
jgi:DHA1 family bicyclomycin/chloramphenicol resistance-like MFS transporter